MYSFISPSRSIPPLRNRLSERRQLNGSIDRASFGVLEAFHNHWRSGAGFSVSLPNWNSGNLSKQTKNLGRRNR